MGTNTEESREKERGRAKKPFRLIMMRKPNWKQKRLIYIISQRVRLLSFLSAPFMQIVFNEPFIK